MMMKRNYLDDTPAVGVLKAVGTVLLTHGAFIPAATVAVLLFHSWLVVPFLFAPGGLMLFSLAIACVLRIWNINGFYRAVLGKIQDLYRPSYTSWRRGITRNIAYPALGAALLLGFGQETGFLPSIALMVALSVNFFVVGGVLFSRKRQHSAGRSESEAQLALQLAQAMVDFFTSPSDPKYKQSYEKPKHGLVHNIVTNKTQMVTVTYVNEEQRVVDTLGSITDVNEVKPGVFKVNIRNKTTKDDDALLKTVKAVASQLGAYDWESKDEDERAGFITLTFWMVTREDATTIVTPYLLWNTQGDNQ